MFSVENKVVVITGCTGQLGFQYSNAFLKAGAKVVGIDITTSAKLEELYLNYGSRFVFKSCDITNKEDIINTCDFIIASFSRIDVLVNNAAIDSPPNSSSEVNCCFEDFNEQIWDKTIDVNLKGVFLCCQIFGKQMVKNGGGSIINVSSIYGYLSPDPNIYKYRFINGEEFYKPVAYSASKGALHNLTRYLAVYWAKKDIRVNTVVLAGVENNQDQNFINAYCERIPIGRMAKPDEYNGLMLFLASNSSSYLTGGTIVADGGWTSI